MTNKEEINILHISDLHFEQKNSPKFTEVGAALIKKIIELPVKPNFIVITGDISEQGDENELKSAGEFINKLIKASNLDNSKILMVPGNHDKKRIEGQDEKITKKENKDFLNSQNNISDLTEKYFSNYRDFANNYLNFKASKHTLKTFSLIEPHDDGNDENESDISIVGIKLFINSQIAFVLLNSSWLCERSDKDIGKLTLGSNIIINAKQLISKIKKQYGSNIIIITLIHHPPSNFSWLDLNDLPTELNNLSQTCEFSDIILSGHAHGMRISKPDLLKNKTQHFISGALFPNHKKSFSASLLKINIELRRVNITSLEYECDQYKRDGYFNNKEYGEFTLNSSQDLIKKIDILKKENEKLNWLLDKTTEKMDQMI